MDVALWTLFAPAFVLAYVNGANDVSKGVATLVGSGVSSYRGAIVWGAPRTRRAACWAGSSPTRW